MGRRTVLPLLLLLGRGVSFPSTPVLQPLDADGKTTGSQPCNMANEVPKTKKCAVGKSGLRSLERPIILAGEGKTGTETLSTVLAMLGLRVAHYESMIQCCSLPPVTCVQSTPGQTCIGVPLADVCCPVDITCIRSPPGQTCNGVSWETPYIPYTDIIDEWTAMPTHEYDDADWCKLDVADAFADVPMPSLTPYLYSAYGPGTKIIISEVNADDWATARALPGSGRC